MHILLIHQAFADLDEPGGTRHAEMAHYLAGDGQRLTIIASPVSYLTGKSSTAEPQKKAVTSNQPGVAPPPGDLPPGVVVHRAYTYPALHKSFVHRVFSFFSFMASSFLVGLSVRRVDLVWGTSPPIFQGITAWTLARLKGVPFLFEVRDLWPAFAIGVGVLRSPFLIRLSQWLEGFLYRQADLVLVNSPGFLEHVRKGGARRTALIPNGADPRMFDPLASGVEQRLRWRLEGKFVALYAGAHGMSNDLDVLLQAAELLQSEPPALGRCPITIVLLGDGKEKPALMANAQRRGLGNVVFRPPLPKAEMAAALAAADVCVAILKPIPLYATVFPNKVFDYMAAGRPVVLAIDGVIRQAVEEAQAGVFARPGDPQALAEAIRSLAADPQRARQMGMNGRRLVEEKFDRAELARELAQILAGLVKNGA
jgi:glycosyltransferase involved in cell wall biosynthesis